MVVLVACVRCDLQAGLFSSTQWISVAAGYGEDAVGRESSIQGHQVFGGGADGMIKSNPDILQAF
jgi:hypothetical protein